ncbi:MAG: hypothetical protein JST05_01195 [Acidobacteria bacterium]|nr:hypothetical protein [Acidobacteriota bacterium]
MRGETRDRRETVNLTFHGIPNAVALAALTEALAVLMREARVAKVEAEWIGDTPPWKLPA